MNEIDETAPSAQLPLRATVTTQRISGWPRSYSRENIFRDLTEMNPTTTGRRRLSGQTWQRAVAFTYV